MFELASFKYEELSLYLACVWARTLKRTKNIHCISHLFAESKHCIWRVVGLALFKNEEYTLHLALLGWHTLCFTNGIPIDCLLFHWNGTNGTNGSNRQVVSARLSSVNICSLQMEHRSVAFFSIGAIDSSGTNRRC